MPDELPKRLPLALQQDNRSGDTSTYFDPRLVNCYLENDPNGGSPHVIKRAGMTPLVNQDPVAGVGRGMITWMDSIYYVVGDTLYSYTGAGPGVSIGTVDATAGFPYFFSSNLGATPTLCLSNTIVSYAYNSSIGLVTMASLGGTNPPEAAAGMVPGFCFIDGTMYFFSQNTFIQGSGINDFTTWDTLNSIAAQIEPDFGIALGKQIVYLIAFKEWTTEVFYDNGNPTGSPLQSDAGGKINYGCSSPSSVQEIDGQLFWISRTKNGSPQVCNLNNLSCTVISTPAVEKYIVEAAFDTVYSWCYKGDGHCFYVLTVKEANITLAYDLKEGVWAQWTDSNGNYVPIVACSFLQADTALLHESNGKIYTMSRDVYQDDGNNFPVHIYTPNFDAGVDRRKMITLMRFNGDTTDGCILNVRCNDHDYSPSHWTNYRQVDMGKQRPILTNCGTFYRRAYDIYHQANTALRLNTVDLTMEVGQL